MDYGLWTIHFVPIIPIQFIKTDVIPSIFSEK